MLSHWVDISFRDFIRPWIFCDQAKGYQNQRGKSLMVPSVIDVLLAFSIDFAVGDPPGHPTLLFLWAGPFTCLNPYYVLLARARD